MALFLDVPRVVAREWAAVSTEYPSGQTSDSAFISFSDIQMALDADTGTFGYLAQTRDTLIRESFSRNYRSGPAIFDGGVGSTQVSPSHLPRPALSLRTSGLGVPLYTSGQRWMAEYSVDRSFVSSVVYYNGVDSTLFYFANSNPSAVPSIGLDTGLKHTYRYGVDPHLIPFSSTNVWIFTNRFDAGSGLDRQVHLAVWDGTSVVSETRLDLGATPIEGYQVVLGPHGVVYLSYSTGVLGEDSVAYLRAIDTTTLTLSAVLWTKTSLSGTGVTYFPQTVSCNKIHTVGGVNYLVSDFMEEITVHSFATATPTVLTLTQSGAMGSPGFSTVAVEADPVSDTAHVVSVGAFATSPRTQRINVSRSSVDITSLSWSPSSKAALELPSFDARFPPGTTPTLYTTYRPDITYCYIPSHSGSSRESFLFYGITEQLTASPFTASLGAFYVRLKNWNDPTVISGELDLDVTTDVPDVTAVCDYRVGMDAALEADVITSAQRQREITWYTRWQASEIASGDSEVIIELTDEPDLQIDGTTDIAEVTEWGEVIIELAGEPGFDFPAEVLRFIDAEADIDLLTEVEIDALSERPQVIVGLTLEWLYTGVTFVQDFMTLLNDERMRARALGPYLEVGTDSISLRALHTLDIAEFHSRQMESTAVFAHSSSSFAPGLQSIAQRVGLIAARGSENILFFGSTGFVSGSEALPSADQVFTAWKNSPPHYQNMVYNWGGDEGLVYSNLGVVIGQMPSEYSTGYDDFTAVYFTNNFLVIKETPVETSLTQYWGFNGIDATFFTQTWNSSYFQPVRSEHSINYALTMASEVALPYGGSVARESEFPWTSSIRSEVDVPYSLSSARISTENSLLWSLDRVRASAEQSFTYSAAVSAEEAFNLGFPARVTAEHDLNLNSPTKLAQEMQLAYGALQSIAREFNVYAPLGTRVISETALSYALRDRELVLTEMAMPYSLDPDAVAADTPEVYLSVGGKQFRVQDGFITSDSSGSGFKFECKLDPDPLMASIVGMEAQVLFVGQAYSLIVTGCSGSAAAGSNRVASSFTITAFSPSYLLDSPYSGTIVYTPDSTKLLSVVLSEIVGQAVTWEIVDWEVEPNRVSVQGVTPLTAANQLLASVGALLVSMPNGGLKAVYRYSAALSQLDSVPLAATLVDDNQVFSTSSQYQFNSGYNSFRVRDSDSSFGDQIEFDADDSNPFTGVASVYLSPYRSNWELATTAESGVVLEDLGEQYITETEVVEFKAGQARAQRPIMTLTSLTWFSTSLGGVSATQGSPSLTATTAVNAGYGLAEITYSYRRHDFRVSAGSEIKATQLIVKEL